MYEAASDFQYTAVLAFRLFNTKEYIEFILFLGASIPSPLKQTSLSFSVPPLFLPVLLLFFPLAKRPPSNQIVILGERCKLPMQWDLWESPM